MARNRRRRLGRGRRPEPAEPAELPAADDEELRVARRWARRMERLYWGGFACGLLMLFTAARFPAWLLLVGPLTVAVSGTAAHAIGRAALVAPDRFPVRYRGGMGQAKGAPFMAGIAVFATVLTVGAAYYVFGREN